MFKWVITGALVLAGLVGITSYNGIVRLDEKVSHSYGDIQNVMQRQTDLIPNLVETVKGYASHESGTLVHVAEARSKLTAVAKMNPEDLAKNPELQKQLIEAQASMQKSMVEVNSLKEAYPQLQANDNFKSLMVELSGSVNRVAQARRTNQNVVEEFNATVRVFPRSLVASIGGFSPKPYFKASDEAQTAPKVKF